MADEILRFTPTGLNKISRRIQAAVDRAIERIWKSLWRWAEEWSRRVARVTPVDTGHLRQNWFIVARRQGNLMTITLANHLQYGRWLEFGTDHIAHGWVLSWKPGDPPIMHWPAKDRNLQYSIHDSPKKHARMSKLAEKAGTVGQGEQMPMVRPVAYMLIDEIRDDIERIVRAELGRAS